MGGWLAVTMVLVFVSAFLAPVLHRWLGDRCGPLLSVVPLAAAAVFGSMIPRVLAGEAVVFRHDWVPSLGISLDFHVDGLGLLFLLLISTIGTFVTWYAAGYLAGKKDLGRFYLYLFGFMGSMLGVVSADHLVLLFVFWELTSISSYLLIGHHHGEAKSRAAALQALLVTGAGGLCLLAGVLLLGRISGTFLISELLRMDAPTLAAQPGFTTALVLVLLGAFTKSAQFPFHFWLPNAMAAPAPVSAYLHSATMVKAGVFLLARLFPVMSASPLWFPVVAPVGAVTMVAGVWMALWQSDLKKILAYTTISVLGTLVMLLGIGTGPAVKAAMAYLLAHALYKAALFMTSGTVDHETGARDADQLGGLRRAMPLTALAALAGSLSMAGIPLMFGFVSKEYVYKALLDGDVAGVWWVLLAVAASAIMAAAAVTAGIKPFWGVLKRTPLSPHEAPWTMWLGPVLLGVAGVVAGCVPPVVATMPLGPAVAAVLGDARFVTELKWWHGWTAALGLSGITWLLGWSLYAGMPRIRAARGVVERLARFGPERLYDRGLAGLLAFAGWQTRVLQNGYLRNYILTVILFTVLLVGAMLPGVMPMPDWDAMLRPHVLTVAVCLLTMGGAVFACLTSSRFTAILALGVTGLGIAMLYFMFSAPDLAMTQVLVETLMLVLFVLAFHRLPVLRNYSNKRAKVRDGVLAAVFGAVMAMVVLVEQSSRAADNAVSRFMGENSLALAKGRNVVNVILVDFRALDTLGEITVLAIAALGVFAMMRLRPRADGKEGGS